MDTPQPIAGARLLFPNDAAVAHLNHGSFGAVPIGVQRAQQRLRDEMDANPTRFFAVGLHERIAHVRRHLATFLGADPDGSALVENATTGTALVLNSLELRQGDEIIVTDHGYGAVALAVNEVCRRTGALARVVALPLAPDGPTVVERVRAALSARTRFVILDEITSATARLLPVRAVAEAVQPTGAPLLVDAAHVPGLRDARVTESGADFWVGNLHKWGFAPRGTALLWVAPHRRDQVRPLVVSWQQPAGFPANVEWQGARDYTAWLAAPVGLFTLRSLDIERVRAHNATLAAYAQRVVADALGEEPPDGQGLPMTVVPLPTGLAGDPEAAANLRRRIADELAAEVAINSWHGRGLLRLSAQVYNRPEEYERLADRLPALLRSVREGG